MNYILSVLLGAKWWFRVGRQKVRLFCLNVISAIAVSPNGNYIASDQTNSSGRAIN
jgi:hypothetical protein